MVVSLREGLSKVETSRQEAIGVEVILQTAVNGTHQRETQETSQASDGKTIKTPNMEHPLRLDGYTHLGTKGSSPRPLERH